MSHDPFRDWPRTLSFDLLLTPNPIFWSTTSLMQHDSLRCDMTPSVADCVKNHIFDLNMWFIRHDAFRCNTAHSVSDCIANHIFQQHHSFNDKLHHEPYLSATPLIQWQIASRTISFSAFTSPSFIWISSSRCSSTLRAASLSLVTYIYSCAQMYLYVRIYTNTWRTYVYDLDLLSGRIPLPHHLHHIDVFISTNTFIHIHSHAHTHTNTHTHTHIFELELPSCHLPLPCHLYHMHLSICTRCIDTYTHSHTHTHTSTRTAHTCTQTHTRTHAHTYTRTHMYALESIRTASLSRVTSI